jgi:hypothetical protein|tara:strand:- start:1538 stop:1834 length:297 start_codon:yes stop_codon:yes gene_type:complete
MNQEDNDGWTELQTTELDVDSILKTIVEWQDGNGGEAMERLIESKITEHDKWPVALVHSISMRYLFDLIGRLQQSVTRLQVEVSELRGDNSKLIDDGK